MTKSPIVLNLKVFQSFTVGHKRAPRDTAIINQPTERLPPTPPARPRISHLNSTFLFIFAHGATMCVPEPCVHASMPSVSVRPYCTHSHSPLHLCPLTSIPFTSSSPPLTHSLILSSTFILFHLRSRAFNIRSFNIRFSQILFAKNLLSANQPFVVLLFATTRSSSILFNLYCFIIFIAPASSVVSTVSSLLVILPYAPSLFFLLCLISLLLTLQLFLSFFYHFPHSCYGR